MNYNIFPLFKSHYSIGRSVLTLDKIWDSKSEKPKPIYTNSIFQLLLDNKLDTLILVENSISSLPEANQRCKDYKLNLIFGLTMVVCNDLNQKDEESIKSESKYIIFLKNTTGYKDLIKISSKACTDGFYYIPRIDFTNLKKLWSKNLKLSVPFYDNFLHKNSLESHQCIPEFEFLDEKPVFFMESHDLPIDEIISSKVKNFCSNNNFETLNTSSIFYPKKEDFLSYLTFRAINQRTSCSCPNLNGMSSDTFSFEHWMEINK